MGCLPSKHTENVDSIPREIPVLVTDAPVFKEPIQPLATTPSLDGAIQRPESTSENSISVNADLIKEMAKPDPRQQILTYFSVVGSQLADDQDVLVEIDKIRFLEQQNNIHQEATETNIPSSVFTVWRPCSSDAIEKMMNGQGVGKGLDIKGKSAKAGALSGFVPYLQIHIEDDKSKVQTLDRGGRTRIFFASERARNAVMEKLEPLQNHLLNVVQDAKRTVKSSIFSLGSGVAAAGRSTTKAVLKVSSSAAASLKTSLPSPGSSSLSFIESSSSVSLPEGDDDPTVSTNGEPFQPDITKRSNTSSTIVECSAAQSLVRLPTSLTTTVLSIGKQSSDFVASAADCVVSPIHDGIRKRASIVSSVASSIGQQAVESVTDISNRVSVTARSSLDLAASSASNMAKPLCKTVNDLTPKGLGLGGDGSKNDSEVQWALKRLLWDMDDPSIRAIDDLSPGCFGIELPDRLLWQAFVVDSDISRPEDSKHYTGRPSQPAFQDMNFIAITNSRKTHKKCPTSNDPLVVLWQTCIGEIDDTDDNPMDPRGLVMAYEERGRVLPVVSDFDCFTMGTRNVTYEPLPEDQLDLLSWCVSSIEQVLDKQDSTRKMSWTAQWLQVLKSSSATGFHPNIPKYGFGDKKSYRIVKDAVAFLNENGAVRHGAECFNFYFPQELDNEFLIVFESFPEKWRYVNVSELQDFLSDRIEEGYVFPMNPKWILCDDSRWKDLYDRLHESRASGAQESLRAWYPLNIQHRMNEIRSKHPRGFVTDNIHTENDECGTEAMDLALLNLNRYLLLRKARVKIFAVVFMVQLLEKVRRERDNLETHLEEDHDCVGECDMADSSEGHHGDVGKAKCCTDENVVIKANANHICVGHDSKDDEKDVEIPSSDISQENTTNYCASTD